VAVPPIFLWQDNATNTSVVAMFHALGYGSVWAPGCEKCGPLAEAEAELRAAAAAAATEGGDPSGRFFVDANGDLVATEAVDEHDDGPGIHVTDDGRVHRASRRSESCVTVEGAGAALCYAWRIDNSGPHSPAEAALVFDAVGALFPGAEVLASDGIDDFVARVLPFKHTLPVVTAEIGASSETRTRNLLVPARDQELSLRISLQVTHG
jgi:hypothetical protein